MLKSSIILIALVVTFTCTIEQAIKHTHYYPNIKQILLLLLALPVGSCSCESSFSALRRLKTWNRSTMTESRLRGLAMLHIEVTMLAILTA